MKTTQQNESIALAKAKAEARSLRESITDMAEAPDTSDMLRRELNDMLLDAMAAKDMAG